MKAGYAYHTGRVKSDVRGRTEDANRMRRMLLRVNQVLSACVRVVAVRCGYATAGIECG